MTRRGSRLGGRSRGRILGASILLAASGLGGAPAGAGAPAEPFRVRVGWEAVLGGGYAGLGLTADRVVTLDGSPEGDGVVAFALADGQRIWRTVIEPASVARAGSGPGPLAAPAAHDGRIFALGRAGRLVALDAATGRILWSRRLPEELGAGEPLYGFGAPPLPVDDLVLVLVDGLTAFEAGTGAVRWRASASGTGAYGAPAVLHLAGRSVIVAPMGRRVVGLDPGSGEPLWEIGNGAEVVDAARAAPRVLAAGPDRFLVADSGGAVLYVVSGGGPRHAGPRDGVPRELWRTRDLGGTFARPVVHGSSVYGFRGEFLTRLALSDGARRWRSRPPGGKSLVRMDDHLAINGGGGAVIVAGLEEGGYREVTRLSLFTEDSYTPPLWTGDRLLVRSPERLVALELVPGEDPAVEPAPPDRSGQSIAGRLAEALQLIRKAPQGERASRMEALLEERPWPWFDEDRVHFVHRSPGGDVAIEGSMLEVHASRPMARLSGTDLFHLSLPSGDPVRWFYRFVVDGQERRLDPLNPDRTWGDGVGWSEARPPGWQGPEPAVRSRPGGVATRHELEWAGETRVLTLYVPQGVRLRDEDPVAALVVVDGAAWRREGNLPAVLDHLVGSGVVPPLVAVFADLQPERIAADLAGDGVDAHLRWLIDGVPEVVAGRIGIPWPGDAALLGAGLGGAVALAAAVTRPDLYSTVAAISPQLIAPVDERWLSAIRRVDEGPGHRELRAEIRWFSRDLRLAAVDLDLARDARTLVDALRAVGIDVGARELGDSSGWPAWREHVPTLLDDLLDSDPAGLRRRDPPLRGSPDPRRNAGTRTRSRR